MSWIDKVKGFFTSSQSDLPWSQTFRMQMRAPAIANRLFDTKAHMIEYISDTTDKASAFVGMVLSVNHSLVNDPSGIGDGTLNEDDGLYLVTKVGANAAYKRISIGDSSESFIWKTVEQWQEVDIRTVFPKDTILIYSNRFSREDPETHEVIIVPGLKIADGINPLGKLQFIDAFTYKNEIKDLTNLGTILEAIEAKIDEHLADPNIHHTIEVDSSDIELLKIEKANLTD